MSRLTIKKLSVVVGLLVSSAITSTSHALDPAYHELNEIRQELFAFAEEYPDWVFIDTIGRSGEFEIPILMAKLSDNPHEIEPEPALLYIGQVHAEEVVGVEITLELMRILLENRNDEECGIRLESLELYFIPTGNPDGLIVVHSGDDVTFRKNCRDNIGDGFFRAQPGIGFDTSGVDINRNFGLHWDRGDTLFHVREDAPYNYYRGPSPFSEPETRAMVDLALGRRFLFSINYHSSRSGVNSELVIAPWTWGAKIPPDADAIDEILMALADRIPTQDGQGLYDPVHSTQRCGQSLDWFYQATGAFQYLIEVGDEIQPDSTTMRQLIDDNLEAAFFLMDLALGRESLDGFGYLTVQVSDGNTGLPLDAEVFIEGLSHPVMEPRLTVAETGRLDWYLSEADYIISVNKRGYLTWTGGIELISGHRVERQVSLEPSDRIQLHLRALDRTTERSIQARIQLDDNQGDPYDFTIPEDEGDFELPVGSYDFVVTAPGYLPFPGNLQLLENMDQEFRLSSGDSVFIEDFEILDNWQHGGQGDDWGILDFEGRSVLTESLEGEYSAFSSCWLMIETDVEVDSSRNTIIELINRTYLEPGEDWGLIDIWDPWSRQWINILETTGFPTGWDTTYIRLDELITGSLNVRFKVESDGSLEEDGWMIDRFSVFQSDRPGYVSNSSVQPLDFVLYAYPNPFNSLTDVVLNLPMLTWGSLELYDNNGRCCSVLAEGWMEIGKHRFIFDGRTLSSGNYYLSYRSDDLVRTLSLTFMK